MDSLASQAESGDNIKVKKYTFLKVTLTANCDINTVTKNRERLFKGAYLLNHLSLLLVLHMLKKNVPFSSRDSLQILIIFTQRWALVRQSGYPQKRTSQTLFFRFFKS